MIDFEKLRRERNLAVSNATAEMCERLGVKMTCSSFDPDACYCNCPDGPCEHDFQGWREFEDGLGGEQVCSRCQTGAMSHSMRVGP